MSDTKRTSHASFFFTGVYVISKILIMQPHLQVRTKDCLNGAWQWRSEGTCSPGPTLKRCPFHPSNLLKFKMKEDYFSCIFKDIRINKAS